MVAVSFTAYLASPVPVDDEGNPLYPIMLWLDTRAAGKPEELWKGFPRIEGYNAFRLLELLRITGGAPGKTGKDTVSKVRWLKDCEPDVYRSARYILDARGYLVMRATGTATASPDEAGLTWLADTRSLPPRWHSGLAEKYGIDPSKLPPILESTAVAGRLSRKAAGEMGLEPGIPVAVGSGDLTAAAVGSGAIGVGEVHVYVGTSSWLGAHVRHRVLDVSHYMGSIPSAVPGSYLLVAEQEVAGAAVDWALRVLKFRDYAELEEEASRSPPGSRGLIFAPWMFGERSPVDDPYLRGALLGISLEHGRSDVARAVIEGVAANIAWSWRFFVKLLKGLPRDVVAVGGACRINLLCTALASLMGVRIKVAREPENASLRGAAMLAAVAVGAYRSLRDAALRVGYAGVFESGKWYPDLVEKLERVYRRLAPFYRAATLRG